MTFMTGREVHRSVLRDGERPGAPEQRLRGARGPAVIVPLVVGVVAALLTALGSWIPSLWGDEAATVLSAERSLPSLWAQTQHLDAMHASYYLVMHFWIGLFGASPFSVRLPSALAVGAAGAGVVVLLRLFGRGWAFAILGAAAFVALPRIEYIGQEARSFALDAALACWAIVVFVAVVQERLPRRRGLALFALITAVATCLFPFDFAVVVITGLVLLAGRQRRLWRGWALCSAIALVVAGPVLVLSYLERGQVAYLASTGVTLSDVLVGTWFGNGLFATLAWLLIAIALADAVRRAVLDRSARRAAPEAAPSAVRRAEPVSLPLLLVIWGFLPLLVLLVTEPVAHNFAERYVAFCTPAIGALTAEGVRALWLWKGWPAALAAACLLGVGIPAALHQRTPYSESGSDWAQLGTYLHREARPGSDVLFAQTVTPSRRARNALRLYPQDFAGLHDAGLVEPWFDIDTMWHDEALTIAQAVEDHRVTTPTVWVVETRGSGDEGMAQLTAAGYHLVQQRHFDIDTVYEFAE